LHGRGSSEKTVAKLADPDEPAVPIAKRIKADWNPLATVSSRAVMPSRPLAP